MTHSITSFRSGLSVSFNLVVSPWRSYTHTHLLVDLDCVYIYIIMLNTNKKRCITAVCLMLLAVDVAAFTRTPVSSLHSSRQHTATVTTAPTTTTRLFEQPEKPNKDDNSGKNPIFDFIFNPYESKIPAEIQKEIYEAEGNTAVAAERTQRIIKYAAVAFLGVLFSFFNVFLSELRSGPTPDGEVVDLVTTSFGWVQSNPITSFLFLNKIGGGICLLGGAGAGLLAEAEFDTRRIQAEKIYEEMERRRANKSNPAKKKNPNKKKKRRSGKETKRLEALSEVVSNKSQEVTEPVVEAVAEAAAAPSETVVTTKEESVVEEPADADDVVEYDASDNEGIFGKLKGFYAKADSMAASQALLLNKELEDKGVIDKITDETGLKVIGKDAAAKLKEEKKDDSKQ